jgi:hypothetical protein
MGNVTKSSANNIKSPDGNSLAIFVDGDDDVMKIKDVRGNVQDISNYTGSESSYLYAYSDEVQLLNIVENIVTFNNLQLNKNINLTNENTITFDKKGIYNFTLSLQLNDTTGNFEFAIVNILNNEQPINYSSKEYYLFGVDSVKYAISYNITLNIVGSENLKFNIVPNFNSTILATSPNTTPSATLTITKIG